MSKQLISIILIISLLLLAGCKSKKSAKDVVIYCSSESFRIEHIQEKLNEEFPDYNIQVQYYSTGNNAAKLKAEGQSTECDIVLGLEATYMEGLTDMFADLSKYDSSMFLDELVPEHHKYFPWGRESGAIIINRRVLEENNLDIPTSYDDLLDPQFKGLISMPNPKASGTGYFFLKNMVNERGETGAFEYFDKLTPNVLQYTSSGAGPVNALVQGEVAIGLGMTFQAVNEINNGVPLEIMYFKEGAPYTISAFGVIKGKEENPVVDEVFRFILNTIVLEDKELFSPEQIYKDITIDIPNYPQDIPYGNMEGNNDIVEKENLLGKWTY